METRKLQHFLAVCEHGSLQRAAEHCHLTPSALSRSLAALARELGVPLFEPEGRRLRASAFGRALQARAERLLQEERELQRLLQSMNTGESGVCALGLSPTPAGLVQGLCLQWLARERPGLQTRIAVGQTRPLLAELRRDRYDLLVIDASALDLDDAHDLSIEALPPLPGGLVCRSGHPLAALAATPDFAALSRYPLACSPLSPGYERRLAQALGRPDTTGPLLSLQSDHFDALTQACLHSDLVLLVAHALVREELASGRLVVLASPQGLPTPAGHYALVSRRQRVQLPALNPLRALIRQRFEACAEAASRPS